MPEVMLSTCSISNADVPVIKGSAFQFSYRNMVLVNRLSLRMSPLLS